MSSWSRDGDALLLDVSIPPNVTASVHLPCTDPTNARNDTGSQPVGVEEFCGDHGMREAIFEIGPGAHHFVGEYAVPDRRNPMSAS